jgi:uncharacterized membrane protein
VPGSSEMTKQVQERAESTAAHLPTHVQEAIQAIAAMHASHREQASWLDRFVDRLTATVAKASFLFVLAALLMMWTLYNVTATRFDLDALDAPPSFPVASFMVSCVELFIAVLILASQTRADRLANLREQMTLETVLLNTQKASKLIDLMEELRRDSPNVKDRVDLEAMEMAGLPDHDTVLSAIQEINENLPAEG